MLVSDFELALSPLQVEAGGVIAPHVLRGSWSGPEEDLPALRGRLERWPDPPRFPADVPTVLVLHALTGDARAAGPQGWWGPVIGPGRALDTRRMRVLCFNLPGSCYGSSGPLDPGFPAVITTWDQARSLLSGLDALGIDALDLVTGGSLGAMITLCLAALAPERVRRIAPIAGAETASAWVVGLNHVGRELVRGDPGFPADPARGLSLARQLAMLSYRAEPGLEARQPRPARWDPGLPHPVSTYLEHQGAKLVRRFDGRSYLALLGAMDHHDLARDPATGARTGFGLPRIRASALSVGIDSDLLFFPHHARALAERLAARGVHAETAEITSPHGHDAFLIEWEQLDAILARALRLPAGSPS
jgi:homoserine O-acetyltransferase